MASLLPEPLVTYGTSGSALKDAWCVTASHPPFVKASNLVAGRQPREFCRPC